MPRTWTRALVTGASSGIGEALARQLAEAGTDLVLVARSRDRLEEQAAALSAAHGVTVEVLPADLGDRAQLGAVEARVATDEDAVDLLVNNAGYGFSGQFGEVAVEDEDAEIQVNVVALMRLCHAAVSRMKPSGLGGGILNVSSTASFQPGPGSANYGATKAYVTSFSQSLHEECRPAGMTVTALCPGLTRTAFQERGGYEVEMGDFAWQTADEVATIGLAAVASGRAVVVSGLLNKTLQVLSRAAPLSVARLASGKVYSRVR